MRELFQKKRQKLKEKKKKKTAKGSEEMKLTIQAGGNNSQR